MITLSDKDAIIDVVNGIGIYADKHDWLHLRAMFINEPEIDYSSLTGQPASLLAADDLIAAWSSFLPKFRFTQHFISNHQVTIDGNHATCFSYVHAIHQLPNAEGGDFWGIYGSYEHELQRVVSNWKVSKLKFTLKYHEGNKNLPALAAQQGASY